MLPRLANPYSGQTDFAQLARDVPSFAAFLQDGHSGRLTIDFQDDAAVRALTAALLERDFRLRIELPSDRLCPTIPSRLEYLLFVLRLALLTSEEPLPSTLTGLDIGTGASAIYPLLAIRTAKSASSSSTSPFPPLKMLATDINDHSLDFAKRNVVANDLTEAVQLFKVDAEGATFPEEVVNAVEQIDFTMCNPPFYDSHEEIAASLAKKELEPFSKCTGADNEMVTPGGEVAFVSRMVEESLVLGKQKIRWFTSLLGKYSSISPLVDLLKSKKIRNYHVHALPPHGYTIRWVLSWSLQDKRFPLDSVGDPDAPSTPTSAPSFPLTRFLSPATLPATYFTPPFPSSFSSRDPLEHVRETLDEVLRELVGEPIGASAEEQGGRRKRRRVVRSHEGGSVVSGLEWRWSETAGESEGEEAEEREVWIKAWRNVWSRKARRASTHAPSTTAGEDGSTTTSPLLELRISLEVVSSSSASPSASPPPPRPVSQTKPQPQAKLTLTWYRGFDAEYPSLTGFWGYLTRKVGERVKALGGGTEREAEEAGEGKGRKRRRDEGGEKAGEVEPS
ncbi:RHTO0S17e00496g1_1 [Rhodotorula toruloides]|uniref:RHTO0S17e00496g1_1 n=2 Tax=Rhodotorula toruloides TaxID=5286 RepID=A0A061BMH7_RHOTO|nr:RHTO0S17e00496g1_1 [Rhodotorula toruloides]